MKKPFGANALSWLMAGDLVRNLANGFKFHPRRQKAQESQTLFWAGGAAFPLTW
jgi:hypothetical protein